MGFDLHYRIDALTAKHVTVAQSHSRLVGYRRYANPLVDVFYDHFLTLKWSKEISAREYVQELYRSIERYSSVLPENCRRISERMIGDDWLSDYGTFEGLAKNLARMERRIQWGSGREVDLVGSLEILKVEYEGFEEDFEEFWPRLLSFES